MTLTYLEFNKDGISSKVLENNQYSHVGNAIATKGSHEFSDGVTALSTDKMDVLVPLATQVGAYIISEKRTLSELEDFVKSDVIRMAEQKLNDATIWYNTVQSHENNKLDHFVSQSLRDILADSKNDYLVEKRALENGSSDEDTTAILTIEEIDGKLRAIDDVLRSDTRDQLNQHVMHINDEQISAFAMFKDVTGTAYDANKEYDYQNTWDTGFETFRDIVRTDGYLSVIALTAKLG